MRANASKRREARTNAKIKELHPLLRTTFLRQPKKQKKYTQNTKEFPRPRKIQKTKGHLDVASQKLPRESRAAKREGFKRGGFPSEGSHESKIAVRQWGVNFCRETSSRETSRCLAGPSGKVRAYPMECGEQLGRNPSRKRELQIPCFKEFFFLAREQFGTRPFLSPSLCGIRLYFVLPHFPSPILS